MFKFTLKELKKHLPFTAIGVATGIIIMLISYNISSTASYNIFYILHPLHILLSSFTTASMYMLHAKDNKRSKILAITWIGYIASVGIATISDSLIPYLSEFLLNLPNKGIHLGFIEKWWLVNPLAFLGILIAYFKPTTKFPHAGHVLLSTWASTFHIKMSVEGIMSWYFYMVVLVFLFFSVWLPCCTSDIIFPLIFARLKNKSKNSTDFTK